MLEKETPKYRLFLFHECFSRVTFNSFSTENLHLAGNVSNGTNIPLRSVNIPNQRLYRGPIHCISSILQTEGLQGLYRGAGAMILRDVPGYMLYFIPYTIFCDLLKPDATSSPNPCSIWLAGGLAGKCHNARRFNSLLQFAWSSDITRENHTYWSMFEIQTHGAEHVSQVIYLLMHWWSFCVFLIQIEAEKWMSLFLIWASMCSK